MRVSVEVLAMASVGPIGVVTVEVQSSVPGPPGGQLLPGEATPAELLMARSSISSGGNGPVASTTMLMVTTAPGARSPSGQLTVLPSGAVHAGLSDDTNVSGVGSTSVTTTAGAT